MLSRANRGAADATNAAIRAARGRYVALFAADDICRPNRLERELRYLDETGLRIVFSWTDFIGDVGEPLSGEHFASRWFNHPRQTRAEMLAWFFFRGNYLCTVSCLAERQLFVDAGLFPVTSAQLPDFAMWLALVKQHELGLLPERLVEYRVHSDGANVSTPANSRRAYFEMCQIHRGLFSGCPADLFRAAFARTSLTGFADGRGTSSSSRSSTCSTTSRRCAPSASNGCIASCRIRRVWMWRSASTGSACRGSSS